MHPTIDQINKLEPQEIRQLKSLPQSLSNQGDFQRMFLPPQIRLPLLGVLSGMAGCLQGLTSGYKQGSLQFFAENAHRLPNSKNGWFFYHRQKSYYCFQKAFKASLRRGFKISAGVTSIFAVEAYLDYVRGMCDFANTFMALTFGGWCLSNYYGMTSIQSRSMILRGAKLGLFLGLAQDIVTQLNGGKIWYMEKVHSLI